MTVEASTVQCNSSGPDGADLPAQPAMEWLLRRNCSMAPRAVLRLYGVMSVVCLAIGAGFWWLGATLVIPFAGLELLALAAALVAYARHAADQECIRLERGVLSVQREWGGRIERVEFRGAGVHVDSGRRCGSLIELSGQGRRVRVGRLVRPEIRRQLAIDLRLELRRVCQGPEWADWVGSRTDDVTRQ